MNPVKINETTYEVTLPRGDKVEIGDRDALDFKPHLKLNRWDGESFIKVGLPTTARSSPVIEGERVGWVEPDLEARFYPLEPTVIDGFTQNEGGGFEFEIILKEKPPTNQIILEIETQGLKYHYQPPLTPEEIAEGAVRPYNVAGSYAVYHDSRGNLHASAQDADKYRCGKAFHIYRPKITDTKGDWVWADLNIDEQAGTLTVTIDQDWLDKAVYPVVIDPNFGYETAGASAKTISSWMYACKFTCPDSGNAQSISWYLNKSAGSSSGMKVALYDASKNLVESGTGTIPDGHDGFLAVNLDTNPAIASADYWLAGRAETAITTVYYDSVGGWDYMYEDVSYSTFPEDPLAGTFITGRKYSVYCTYTAGGVTEKQSSDTGGGADWLPARDIALPDSGSGVDAFVSLQTPAAKTASDNGYGVDALVSLQTPVAKTASDSGAGVEAIPVPAAFLAGSESGSGIEAFIARLLAAAETGYGAEASEIGGGGLLKHLFASELGEGTDGLTAKIEKPTKGGGMRLWI